MIFHCACLVCVDVPVRSANLGVGWLRAWTFAASVHGSEVVMAVHDEDTGGPWGDRRTRRKSTMGPDCNGRVRVTSRVGGGGSGCPRGAGQSTPCLFPQLLPPRLVGRYPNAPEMARTVMCVACGYDRARLRASERGARYGTRDPGEGGFVASIAGLML